MLVARLTHTRLPLPEMKLSKVGTTVLLRIGQGIYAVERPKLEPFMAEALILRKFEGDGEHVLIVYEDGRHHCSCEDFEFSIANGHAGRACKHLAAAYTVGLFIHHCPPGIAAAQEHVEADGIAPMHKDLTGLLERLELIAGNHVNDLIAIEAHRFRYAVLFGQAAQELRASLPFDLLKLLMPLANKPYGFGCDREDYPVEIVRECLIDGLLQGVSLTSNEMAIIDGHCMIVKRGWEKKLLGLEGMETVEQIEILGQPVPFGDNDAQVKCQLRWIRNGRVESIVRNCEVDDGATLSISAIVGKCERKMYQAAFRKLLNLGAKPVPRKASPSTLF